VIGEIGEQFGVVSIADALAIAQSRDLDLVEIAPHATPPLCRIVDDGKFRAQLSRRKN
jgi:translation initiation factor IF-3